MPVHIPYSEELPELTLEGLVQVINRGADSVKNLPSSNIFSKNGEYIGTFVIPSKDGGDSIYDYMKSQVEAIGIQGNSVIQPVPVEEPAREPEIDEKPIIQIPADNPLACLVCGYSEGNWNYIAKSKAGLASHMRGHHKRS